MTIKDLIEKGYEDSAIKDRIQDYKIPERLYKEGLIFSDKDEGLAVKMTISSYINLLFSSVIGDPNIKSIHIPKNKLTSSKKGVSILSTSLKNLRELTINV